MVSTIHIKTSQNLSPGGRGRKIFFFGGGGGVKWFSGGTRRGISRRQLSIKVGLLTINCQWGRIIRILQKPRGDQADFVVTQVQSTRIILPPSPSPSPSPLVWYHNFQNHYLPGVYFVVVKYETISAYASFPFIILSLPSNVWLVLIDVFVPLIYTWSTGLVPSPLDTLSGTQCEMWSFSR